MEIKQLDMREMDLSAIDTATYNPRKDLRPGDKAYERLKQSILTYGYIDPMIYNSRTGRLVGGHQRLKILRDLGIKKAQVSVVDLDELQEKDLNVRLNRVQGEFETDALFEVLRELERESFDLDNLGFDESEFNALVREMEIENKHNAAFLDHIISDTDSVNTERSLNATYTPSNDLYTDNGNVNVNDTVDRYSDDPVYEKETNNVIEEQTEYFNLSFPVDYEQRDVINRAIRTAKADFNVTTSTEAILQICYRYLNRQ